MKRVQFFPTLVLIIILLFAALGIMAGLPGGGNLQGESVTVALKGDHDHLAMSGNKSWCELFHDFLQRSAKDGALLFRSVGNVRITGLAPGYAIVLIELQLRAPKPCDTHTGPCSSDADSGKSYCEYSVLK